MVNLREKESVLEFGAGHADLSYVLKQKYPHLKIHLVEPDKGFCAEHLKRGVVTSVSNSLDKINQKVDLVVSSHSLEHVIDVKEVMKSLCSRLRPEGHLFFEVPNCHRGFFSNYISDIPHTYFFNESSHSELGKKYGANILSIKTLRKKGNRERPCSDGTILRTFFKMS